MQRGRAARAAVVGDVHHGVDPRQVGRQRAPVGPALGNAGGAHGRSRRLGDGLVGRLGLLGLIQPELELIEGQALRPAAEAVALEFADDLAQKLVLGPLGRQHGLQGGGVVGGGGLARDH